MLYIVNIMTFAFPFHEQILWKVWTSEYDYFFCTAVWMINM